MCTDKRELDRQDLIKLVLDLHKELKFVLGQLPVSPSRDFQQEERHRVLSDKIEGLEEDRLRCKNSALDGSSRRMIHYVAHAIQVLVEDAV